MGHLQRRTKLQNSSVARRAKLGGAIGCAIASLATLAHAQSPALNSFSSEPLVIDSYIEFMHARAAAEKCYGRPLTEDEHKRFVTTLSFRDPERRDRETLSIAVLNELQKLKLQLRNKSCDNPDVAASLFDWRFQVSLFSQIDPKLAIQEGEPASVASAER